MLEKIKQLQNEIQEFAVNKADELENFRIKFLSKKGKLSLLFEEFKTISSEERKNIGKLLNELKNAAQEKMNDYKQSFEEVPQVNENNKDLSLPVNFVELGSRHPISIVRSKIIEIFSRIGRLYCIRRT